MLNGQKGFSLLEMLLVMALSSIMMISVSAFLPELIRQHLNAYRQHRLEQVMRQALFKVEKDLRRAGFVKESTVADAGKFYPSTEAAASCLLVRYDLNRNGKIEGAGHNQSELFGYRLYQGALEQNRGSGDCSGGGWEKIVDPDEISLTDFNIETRQTERGDYYFIVRLDGHWRQNRDLKKRLISMVPGLNL